MTDQEKIAQLEKRIEELERRPTVQFTQPYVPAFQYHPTCPCPNCNPLRPPYTVC